MNEELFDNMKSTEPARQKKIAACFIGTLVIITVVIPVVFSLLFFTQQHKYNKAVFLLENKEYEKAYELFKEIENYKDTKDYLRGFRVLYDITETKYSDGDYMIEEYEFNAEEQVLSFVRKFSYSGNISEDYKCTYDEKGNLVKKEVNSLRGVSKSVYEYKYNNKGDVIYFKDTSEDRNNEVYLEYDEKGNCIKKTGKSIFMYEYDYRNRLIKKARYDKSGNLEMTEKYYYDIYGNQKASEIFNPDGSRHLLSEYTYNIAGNLLTHKETDANGNERKKREYDYDLNGNIIKETTYFGVKQIREFKRDKNGNLLEEKLWEEDYVGAEPRLFSEKKYSYDGSGNCISAYSMYVDEDYGKIDEDWDKYTYDKNGNVIKHESFDRNEFECDSVYEYSYYGEKHVTYIDNQLDM